MRREKYRPRRNRSRKLLKREYQGWKHEEHARDVRHHDVDRVATNVEVEKAS